MTSPGPRRGDALAYLAEELDQVLAVADAALRTGYPGENAARQPVHTAYVPAHRFEPGTPAQWGAQALAALAEHAPGPAELAAATGIDPALAGQVYPLVLAKLASEPVEDLRIDFEDGYGTRGDETEDAHARAAARALAAALREDGAPSFTGLRCKSLEPSTRRRAIRTLDTFLGELLSTELPGTELPGTELPGTERLGTGRPLPPGFTITLPKVTSVAQVGAMTMLCARLEAAYGLVHPRRLTFEIQVETPQLILGQDGAATIARCVHAAAGRLTGLHYGTYDYSAALGVAAAHQSLDHPAADYAKSVMQVAAAGTSVRLCDGSTNILPVGPPDEIIAAWHLHTRLIRRSLSRGFYQGWDLHPHHLVSRYAATYSFYREALPTACTRLRDYTTRAASAQEEPATARALAAFLLRALDCGATTEPELTDSTSLSKAQLTTTRRTGTLP